jgi:hypothetical protein
MIAQGTDCLSQADHSQGVMQGKLILEFVPLHLHPLERAPCLKLWLKQLTAGMNPTILTPEGWYTTGHGCGTFLWITSPAATEVVRKFAFNIGPAYYDRTLKKTSHPRLRNLFVY